MERMTQFQIIDAKSWHVGQMSRLLRVEHQAALRPFGVNVHRDLKQMFDESVFRRAWTIDGHLAALGGVAGSMIETSGYVWVALSDEAQRYPVALVKEARKQMAIIMRMKRELVTSLIGGDEAAIRLAVYLGFHIPNEPGAVVSRLARRAMVRTIQTDPDLRISLGKGYAVGMRYEGEVA